MGRLTSRKENYAGTPDRRPPRWANWLLSRFCPPGTEDEIQGDLLEMYVYWKKTVGLQTARRRYVLSVLRLIQPFSRANAKPSTNYSQPNPIHPTMLRNYLTVAWRNLAKNKSFSTINISGLAVGMAVAMLIGLWIYDEFAFNKYHQNYNRIAKVMQGATINGRFGAGEAMPIPLANTLRMDYPDDFTAIVLSTWNDDHILAYGDKKFTKTGRYIGQEAPNMLTLKMLRGTRAGLKNPSSIFLAESVAQALFGDADPLGKVVRIDNKLNVSVTGVYEDLPHNTEFRELTFMAPWDLYVSSEPWIRENAGWDNNSWQILAQIAPKVDFETVSEKIKNLRLIHVPQTAHLKPEVFLQPMGRWHLYQWDKSGRQEGRIQYVWLFGITGVFVLVLACINFMNLSTARSQKRAKEVGIRKAIGSVRSQLVGQFFSESLLVAGIAFVLSLLVVLVSLPFFNEVADKKLSLPWNEPLFWLSGLGFSLLTGIIAGSYPALYLSSFQPVKVLKGTFRVGRLASLPRQVLVVTQFTVSVTLIIGTIIVFRQIQHAKNRSIGYDRNGLITVAMNTPELYGHYNALRSELIETGAVVEMATSSSPTTQLNSRQVVSLPRSVSQF